MKCPKCHYLSFDPEPRCKNCGYSFSLGESDLTLKPDARDASPLADFDLRRGPAPSVETSPRPVRPPNASAPAERAPLAARRKSQDEIAARPLVPVLEPGAEKRPDPALTNEAPIGSAGAVSVRQDAVERASAPPPAVVRPPMPPTTELPLFVKGMASADPDAAGLPARAIEAVESDEPLVKVPAEPRTPLGVRRTAPDSGVRKAKTNSPPPRKLGPLDRDLLEDLQRIEKTERKVAAADARAAAQAAAPADRATAGARLGSAAIDATFLGAVAALTVWVILRWCDLPFERASFGPLWPIAVFLLLIGVGYLFMFTAAGGQTIGKMLVGIRVVEESPGGGAPAMVSVTRAISRALLTVPSVLALGAGFVPALVGENRAIHDRLAHTRVVRA